MWTAVVHMDIWTDSSERYIQQLADISVSRARTISDRRGQGSYSYRQVWADIVLSTALCVFLRDINSSL